MKIDNFFPNGGKEVSQNFDHPKKKSQTAVFLNTGLNYSLVLIFLLLDAFHHVNYTDTISEKILSTLHFLV